MLPLNSKPKKPPFVRLAVVRTDASAVPVNVLTGAAGFGAETIFAVVRFGAGLYPMLGLMAGTRGVAATVVFEFCRCCVCRCRICNCCNMIVVIPVCYYVCMFVVRPCVHTFVCLFVWPETNGMELN